MMLVIIFEQTFLLYFKNLTSRCSAFVRTVAAGVNAVQNLFQYFRFWNSYYAITAVNLKLGDAWEFTIGVGEATAP